MGAVLSLHESINVEEHAARVDAFFAEAKHPTLGRPYQACSYAPMVELLRYLEANGFTCYIVSGGGRDFMRPDHRGDLRHPARTRRGQCAGPEVRGQRRPRRPVASSRRWTSSTTDPRSRCGSGAGSAGDPSSSAGNSNGDNEMLQYSGSPERLRCGCWSCTTTPNANSTTPQGRNRHWSMPRSYGWTVVSMKNDWTTVFGD